MSVLPRRQTLVRLGGIGVVIGASASGIGTLWAQQAAGRTIEIEARRFQFIPAEIKIKRGDAVTLAIRAVDFSHGFNLPDLGIRVDLAPGKTINLRLQPTQAGRFAFLCDNFCGEKHEEMSGMLIVEA